MLEVSRCRHWTSCRIREEMSPNQSPVIYRPPQLDPKMKVKTKIQSPDCSVSEVPSQSGRAKCVEFSTVNTPPAPQAPAAFQTKCVLLATYEIIRKSTKI